MGSRGWRRPGQTKLFALVGLLSIISRGHAFVGSIRPMAQSGNLRVRRVSDAASSKIDPRERSAGRSSASPGRAATTGPRMAVGSSDDEQELGFADKFKTGWSTVIPIGNPDDLPPCPSGVSDMAKPAQAAIFFAVFAGLGVGTIALLSGLSSLEELLPGGWYSAWQSSWAPFLGATFAVAGVSHFTILKEFSNIYPGRGAWGFWYLPGTASFHVKWTGVAEFVGGLGLALGGFGVGSEVGLEQAAAAGLFALTLAVTPANIYMFTHGAQLPEGLEVPVVGHAIRGALQCVLLAFFWTLANL